MNRFFCTCKINNILIKIIFNTKGPWECFFKRNQYIPWVWETVYSEPVCRTLMRAGTHSQTGRSVWRQADLSSKPDCSGTLQSHFSFSYFKWTYKKPSFPLNPVPYTQASSEPSGNLRTGLSFEEEKVKLFLGPQDRPECSGMLI